MPKFEREIVIKAPVEKTWEVLINPALWPKWIPGIGNVTSAGTSASGVTFEFSSPEGSGTGVITKFEPLKKLEIMTQVGNDKDLHSFDLRSTGGLLGMRGTETKVSYVLDTLMGGGIVGNFVAGGNPADAIRVKKTLDNFRKLVVSL